jgi:hypothetical protein
MGTPANTMNTFGPATAAPNGPGYLPAGPVAEGPGPGFFYADVEYLLWHIKSDKLPLLTTATAAGLSLNITTNQPGPNTLIPMNNVAPVFLTNTASFGNLPNPGEHSGYRVTAGYWCDSDRTFGIDASFFQLDDRGSALTVITTRGNNQFPVATPFTNFTAGPVVQVASGNGGVAPQLNFTGMPVIFTGAVNSDTRVSTHNWLLGGDINTRCIVLQYGCVQIGALAGFRSYAFDEGLLINNQASLSLTPLNQLPFTGFTPGTVQIQTTDNSRAKNTFWGGQIGAEIDACLNRLFFSAVEKVGVGVVHQSVSVDGNTATTVSTFGSSTPQIVTPGGLLVGPGEVGNHSRYRVGFVSDTNLKIGYKITDCFRVHVGYDVLTMTNVVRAGSVGGLSSSTVSATVAGTSTTVSLSQPSFAFHDSTMWVHGLDVGVEFVY